MVGRLRLVASLLLAAHVAAIDQRSRPALLRPTRRPTRHRDVQWISSEAALAKPDLKAMGGGWAAAGGVAGLALASEVLQILNTFVGVYLLNKATGAKGLADLVETVATFVSGLGLWGYPAYMGLLHLITILPLMSAIIFIILAGTVFGVLKGTAIVSLSLSSAAAISATVARRVAKAKNYGLSNIDPRAAAVDAAIAQRSWHTSLLLVTLLRLSPVLVRLHE